MASQSSGLSETYDIIVETSLTGKRWRQRQTSPRLVDLLRQRFGVSDILARLMAARGIDETAAEGYLAPTLKYWMPDPSHLKDMDVAVQQIQDALVQGYKIAVFGDYDVDGATSSALLIRYFEAIGVPILPYIPDRMTEGYGPNIAAFQKLKQQHDIDLVITVDCGIMAFEPLAAAADMGLDVIIIDHHMAEPTLPAAKAIVNPNRLDQDSPLTHLAAVGVVFVLLVALNRQLRQNDFFKHRGVVQPDLMQWLDLVALGTVCDVVSLTGLNRAFVAQGLKMMAKQRNNGLSALAERAGIQEAPTAYHLGFVLGPRLNAGGRVGKASLGTDILSSHDRAHCRKLADSLEQYNQERRDIEADVLDQAIAQIETRLAESGDLPPILIASGDQWHPGVIGIVAGRLKERYDRPAIVIGWDGEIGKGSARSVSGIDIGAVIIAASQEEYLLAGGGHAMAAGLTIQKDQFTGFIEFVEARLTQICADLDLKPALTFDCAVDAAGASLALLSSVDKLAPFGMGNPGPRFYIPSAQLVDVRVVGSDHIRFRLASGQQDRGRRHYINGMAFRSLETPLGEVLMSGKGKFFAFAGQFKIDNWQGREEIKIYLDDIAPPLS